MSSDVPSDKKMEIAIETRRRLYSQSRWSTQIENGDWRRWVRMISSIPRPRTKTRDIAFASLAIGIESLLNALVTLPKWSALPTWVSIIYLVVSAAALVLGITCLVFERKMEKVVCYSVKEVLQDMKEVQERSVRLEEVIAPAGDDAKDNAS